MFLFVLRRLMGGLPTLLLVTVLVFTLTRVLPGDPARLLLGEEATPELVAQIREELGLNRPILVQYADWLWGLVRGDLGRSIRGNELVAPIIWQKLPTTLELSLFSLLVAIAIGIPAGVLAALRRNTAIDASVTVMALSGISIPNFFLGILLIYAFRAC
ncbi:MAG: hypothetical protein KatS3mg070_1538 [Meiothermus sp.]|uniref:ABC transporter permease n=1 Tax=Meiothermus sp. TaxID=1955249 RepID=UPI0021DE7F63|nr:ABC transporter permease [Meiothermus sp.]GIW28175.1 MAG: hypothetical protein KatS3mg070_1538 [Meiothermus sp.]